MTRRIDSLQVLRGFAALGVVVHHCLLALTVNRPFSIKLPGNSFIPNAAFVQLGSAGVDIFFVLSGFLMIYISDAYFSRVRGIGHFLSHRIIRIWPLYALVTAYLYIGDLRRLIATGGLPFDLHLARLSGLIFIPSFNERGLLHPALGVGWTLNYEMLFYLCFSAVLITGRRHAMIKLALMLLALFCIGTWSSGAVTAAFLGNPILFEFLFGAVLGWLTVDGGVSLRRGGLWIVGGVGLILLLSYAPVPALPRPVAFGIPALMIFAGFLALDPVLVWPRWMRLLGDASYSIYLVHILIIYPILYRAVRIMCHLGAGRIAVIGSTVAAVGAAVAAGTICFLAVERPLLRCCQRWYNGIALRSGKPVSPREDPPAHHAGQEFATRFARP